MSEHRFQYLETVRVSHLGDQLVQGVIVGYENNLGCAKQWRVLDSNKNWGAEDIQEKMNIHIVDDIYLSPMQDANPHKHMEPFSLVPAYQPGDYVRIKVLKGDVRAVVTGVICKHNLGIVYECTPCDVGLGRDHVVHTLRANLLEPSTDPRIPVPKKVKKDAVSDPQTEATPTKRGGPVRYVTDDDY